MQQQITGHLVGMEQRNQGWVAVAIHEQGAQYPKKLSTKKQELIQTAQQMMGQYVTALYNESESTSINQHTGQPYVNRYLEAVGLAGTMPAPQPAPQPAYQQPVNQPVPMQPTMQQPAYSPPQQQPVMQQPVQPRQSDAERTAQIHRQSAAKVAVALLPLLTPEDQNLSSLVRISEQLVQYFDRGVQWNVPPVQPQQQIQQPQQAEYQPPPTQDQGADEYGYQPPGDDEAPW